MTELTYRVSGMHCGNCEAAVKRRAGAAAGCRGCRCRPDHEASLRPGDSLSDEELRAAIDDVGFKAEAA